MKLKMGRMLPGNFYLRRVHFALKLLLTLGLSVILAHPSRSSKILGRFLGDSWRFLEILGDSGALPSCSDRVGPLRDVSGRFYRFFQVVCFARFGRLIKILDMISFALVVY